MSRHFKVFDTHAEYQAFVSSGITDWPNVSVCKDRYDAHFNDNGSITPTGETHEYVEIGGVKWATMNIGATAVTDYGLYFTWGDIQGYSADQIGTSEGEYNFSFQEYKYGGGATGIFDLMSKATKYNNTDGKKVLDIEDDGVRAAWGGSWRMPTKDEFVALGAATTSAWTTDYNGSGVAGLVLTDNTDSTKVLFFPAAGQVNSGSISVGSYYWSNTLSNNLVSNSFCLLFTSSSGYYDNQGVRPAGATLRGIVDE